MNSVTAGLVVGQNRDPLAPLVEIAECRRQSRTDAGRALDRLGKFRRVGAGERHDRGTAVIARNRGARGGDRDRAMRVDQHPRIRRRFGR